eukprot:PhM_4_TR18737/c7_g2_i1/m.65852/K07359/CAMKK2; calcium/calmodulin-dependent protein kinase kinase 2
MGCCCSHEEQVNDGGSSPTKRNMKKVSTQTSSITEPPDSTLEEDPRKHSTSKSSFDGIAGGSSFSSTRNNNSNSNSTSNNSTIIVHTSMNHNNNNNHITHNPLSIGTDVDSSFGDLEADASSPTIVERNKTSYHVTSGSLFSVVQNSAAGGGGAGGSEGASFLHSGSFRFYGSEGGSCLINVRIGGDPSTSDERNGLGFVGHVQFIPTTGAGSSHSSVTNIVKACGATSPCSRRASVISAQRPVVKFERATADPLQATTPSIIGSDCGSTILHSGTYPTGPKIITEVVKHRDGDGNKVINNYVVITEIGRGSYAKVKLAINTNDETPVAMKVLRRHRKRVEHMEAVRKEIEIMSKRQHPNIVALHAVIDDPNSEKVYMVLEYVPGGTLTDLVAERKESAVATAAATFDAATFRTRFLDVLHGLQYLHNHNVVHMDIKPENILVGED